MADSRSSLTIVNATIRQDAAGRYSFNDLHAAAVAAGHDYKVCQVANFTRLESTEALLAELRNSEELDSDPWVSTAGRYGGTWGAKELVYAYAMWISPRFHLQVIRAYDALVTGNTQPTLATNPRVQYIADLARAGCLPPAALADLAYRMAPGMPAAPPPATAPSAPQAQALAADYATAEALAPRVGMTAKRLNNLLSRSRWQTWQPEGGWFPTRAGSARALVGTGGIQWSAAAVQELVAAEAGHAASLF